MSNANSGLTAPAVEEDVRSKKFWSGHGGILTIAVFVALLVFLAATSPYWGYIDIRGQKIFEALGQSDPMAKTQMDSAVSEPERCVTVIWLLASMIVSFIGTVPLLTKVADTKKSVKKYDIPRAIPRETVAYSLKAIDHIDILLFYSFWVVVVSSTGLCLLSMELLSRGAKMEMIEFVAPVSGFGFFVMLLITDGMNMAAYKKFKLLGSVRDEYAKEFQEAASMRIDEGIHGLEIYPELFWALDVPLLASLFVALCSVRLATSKEMYMYAIGLETGAVVVHVVAATAIALALDYRIQHRRGSQ